MKVHIGEHARNALLDVRQREMTVMPKCEIYFQFYSQNANRFLMIKKIWSFEQINGKVQEVHDE